MRIYADNPSNLDLLKKRLPAASHISMLSMHFVGSSKQILSTIACLPRRPHILEIVVDATDHMLANFLAPLTHLLSEGK